MGTIRLAIAVACFASLVVAGSVSAEILYGADGAAAGLQQGHPSNLYILSPATGAVLSNVGPIGFAVTGLAVHPTTGVLYGSTSKRPTATAGRLITINTTTGAGAVVGPFNTGDDSTMADLTFTSDGVLYGSSSSDANLYTINLNTGQATKVMPGDDTIFAFGAGLAANASNTLYLATESDDGPLRTVDRTTGATTEVVDFMDGIGLAISAMAFNAAGVLYGALNNPFDVTAQLITINVSTGHITVVGDTIGRLDAIVFAPGEGPGTAPRLVNISTRGQVGTGNDIMIGGLIVEGAGSKTVLVRGRGPSLGGAPFLVPGTLANPLLKVFSGSTLIAQNDNWQDAPSCGPGFTCGTATQIAATGLDPCEPNPGQPTSPPNCVLESAILITLPPGAYTVQLLGASGEVGVGLIEGFDIDHTTNVTLHNLSTRGIVGTGNDIMIGGFIIEGDGPQSVLVRGRGPSLGAAPFFIPGVLPDPSLQIFSGSTAIAQNNNWQSGPTCDPRLVCGAPSQISDLGLDPCQPNPGQAGPPPNCAFESAILITLDPGAYTVFLSGAAGQTGVGLIEIFVVSAVP